MRLRRPPPAILVWALRGTPALALDCYRVFFGSIAVVWFTALIVRRPALIERATCAAVGCAIPTPVLVSALWLGPALACCLVLAVFPRLSAALLFLLASTVTALRVQDTALDDYCIVVVLFWSALLPIGRTLTLEQWFEHSGRFFTHARELRVEGFTTRLMLVNLSFIYLNVGLWRSALPLSSWQRPLEIALCLVPSLYIVPQHLPLRWVASWLQLAVHAWLIWNTREPLANACLAGTAVLFWRERFFAPRPEAAPDHQAIEAPLRLDAAGAIATVYAGLCALVFVAQLTHADQLASQSARLLRYAGLLPNYLIVGAR